MRVAVAALAAIPTLGSHCWAMAEDASTNVSPLVPQPVKSLLSARTYSERPPPPINGANRLLHNAPPDRPRLSRRVLETEPAHIEAVLSKYSNLNPRPANLALGVAHWDPPDAALRLMAKRMPGEQWERDTGGTDLRCPENHRYGPALGLPGLREALLRKLEQENGLDLAGQEVGDNVRERLFWPSQSSSSPAWSCVFLVR